MNAQSQAVQLFGSNDVLSMLLRKTSVGAGLASQKKMKTQKKSRWARATETRVALAAFSLVPLLGERLLVKAGAASASRAFAITMGAAFWKVKQTGASGTRRRPATSSVALPCWEMPLASLDTAFVPRAIAKSTAFAIGSRGFCMREWFQSTKRNLSSRTTWRLPSRSQEVVVELLPSAWVYCEHWSIWD